MLANARYTEKADVYSFAVICWELVMARLGAPSVPYADMPQMAAAVAVLQSGLRPPIPRDCPGRFAQLMERAWAADPDARPAFDEILVALAAC